MALPLNTFDFIQNDTERIMYETALTAITQLELWAFMKKFPEKNSFMFSDFPEVTKIYDKIEELGYIGHSGGSFGLTMRVMQFIATHNIDEFRKKYTKNIAT